MDKALQISLNQTHWGFAEWFLCRLKPIRQQLRGPEVKGVNIVNFMLYENPKHAWRLGTWGKRFNSFEYSTVFQFKTLENRKPIDNVENLMKWSSEVALLAPWPQVIAIGKALAEPLSEQDRVNLLPHLQWPRLMDVGPRKPKFDS
jgi:hypothetical protein